MPVPLIQPAFSRGEISPELFGRVDTNAYQLALKLARNVVVHAYGGASNRAGSIFIGPVKDHTRQTRLIPFKFKTTDTHIIELGHQYIRVIRDDAHIVEPSFTIVNATQATPVVITTSVAHNYADGDEVFISGVQGMTEITEERWLITVIASNIFALRDQVTGANLNGAGFGAYTGGGTAARVMTLVSPYQESELRQIKYVQTADVVTLSHPSHDPRELRRLALSTWQLVVIPFKPLQPPPTNAAITVYGTPAAIVAKYKVTAISNDNDEESLPALSTAASLTITNITKANPAVVTTSASHNLVDGDEIEITGVVGMTEVNDRRFKVNVVDADEVQLRDVDSTGFTTYVSGGSVKMAFVRIATSNTGLENEITWTAVANARVYSLYREDNGLYSFIGETEALKFRDKKPDIVPNRDETPPQERNPFFGTNNKPGTVGSHEQRRVFGGSNNKPDTSFYSRIGVDKNFTVASPTRADDAITVTLPSREVNEIRHYVSLGDLVVFTSGSEWRVRGSTDSGFAFNTIRQDFQSNWGCSHITPIVVGTKILFVLDNGNVIRALGFSVDRVDGGFNSNNISLLIPHLFRNKNLVEWNFSKKPDPIVYGIRNDGHALVLTFEDEQQVIAWAHWDTLGAYESVACIQPLPTSLVESPYFVVRRTIAGNTVRYVEREHSRQFQVVQDAFFVDCGLSLDFPIGIESISLTNPLVITITGHPFLNNDHVDISDITWVSSFDSLGNETQPAQLNGGRFIVANATANTFTLKNVDTGAAIAGSTFAAYVSGGFIRLAVQFLSGLRHLRNTSVSILADGNVLAPQVVSSLGTLTLPRKFSRVHIGLPFISDIETLNVELPQKTVQGVLKRIPSVVVRFERSRGLFIGPSNLDLVEMPQREFEVMGDPTALLSGDKQIPLKPQWNSTGRLFMRQKDPLPMTILAVVPNVEFGDIETE